MIMTIIICTFNRAEMLPRVIESAIRNVHQLGDSEVLIVDNGSSDGTRALVNDIRKNSEVVRYCFEGRIGLSIARNRGLEEASGEFVGFVDDDGELPDFWAQAMIKEICASDQIVGVGGPVQPVFPRKEPPWVTSGSRRFFGEFHWRGAEQSLSWIPGGNSIWRRETLVRLGGFETSLGRIGKSPVGGSEESFLIIRLLSLGYRLAYSESSILFHHIEDRKLTFHWLASRYFGQGLTAQRLSRLRARLPEPESRPEDATFSILFRRAKSAIADFTRAIWTRDSSTAFDAVFILLLNLGRVVGKIELQRFWTRDQSSTHTATVKSNKEPRFEQ